MINIMLKIYTGKYSFFQQREKRELGGREHCHQGEPARDMEPGSRIELFNQQEPPRDERREKRRSYFL